MGCLIAAIGFVLLIAASFFGAAMVFNVMHYFDPSAPVLWGNLASSTGALVFCIVFGVALAAMGLGMNRDERY